MQSEDSVESPKINFWSSFFESKSYPILHQWTNNLSLLGSLWIPIKMFIPRSAHSSSNGIWNILPFCSAYLYNLVFNNESNHCRPTVFANTCIGDGYWTSVLTIPPSAKTHFSTYALLNCFLHFHSLSAWELANCSMEHSHQNQSQVGKFVPLLQLVLMYWVYLNGLQCPNNLLKAKDRATVFNQRLPNKFGVQIVHEVFNIFFVIALDCA